MKRNEGRGYKETTWSCIEQRNNTIKLFQTQGLVTGFVLQIMESRKNWNNLKNIVLVSEQKWLNENNKGIKTD